MRKCYAFAVSLFVLAACGDDATKKVEEMPESVRIVSFTASRLLVEPGTSIELNWEVRHAEEVRLTANDEALETGDAPTGSVSFVVKENTVFRLEATGGGKTTQRKLSAEVLEIDETPFIISFSASPKEIDAGTSTRLVWMTRNVSSVQIVDADGKEIPVGGQPTDEGEVEVSPSKNTSYRLIATSEAGELERVTHVTVRGQPGIEASVSKTVIDVGEEVSLNWAVADALRVVIREQNGPVLLDSASEFQGSLPVKPDRTTTYEVRAIGSWRDIIHTVGVQVRPQILAFEIVEDGPIGLGKLATLRWETAGATELVVSNLDGAEETIRGYRLDAGSTRLPMAAGGSFRLRALGGGEIVEVTVNGEILVPPALGSFSVSPDLQSAQAQAVKVTATWTGITNADHVRLDTDTMGRVGIFEPPFEDGSLDLVIRETTTFTFTVSNGAGEVSQTATSVVVPLPKVHAFTVFPAHAAPTEPVTIQWDVEDAVGLALRFNGQDLPTGSMGPTGSYVHTASEPGTFRLVATNGVGGEVERSRGLTIGQPQVINFASSRDFLTASERLDLSWATRGGVKLTLFEGETEIFSTSDPIEMASGTFRIPSGAIGTYVYKVQIENGLGEIVERTLEVLRTDGPVLLSASMPRTACLGNGVRVVWNAVADSHGVAPDITLSLAGVDHEFPGMAQGNVNLADLPLGEHLAVLTAHTPGTTPHVREFTLKVDDIHFATLKVDPPVASAGQNVTITWDAVCADEVKIPSIKAPVEVFDSAFVDIWLSGSWVDLVDTCGTSSLPEDEGCLVLNFPGGFTFPFDGANHTAIKLYANGVAGFDLGRTGESWDNKSFPSPGTPWANIAPFWDDLWMWLFEVGFYYELTNSAGRTGLIIQWGMMEPLSSLFQMVLWEDGDFDFRYGDGMMSAFSATIGYQNASATNWGVLTQFADPAGGLSNRSWRFEPKSLPAKGSATLTARETTQFDIRAFGNSTVVEIVDIVVQ